MVANPKSEVGQTRALTEQALVPLAGDSTVTKERLREIAEFIKAAGGRDSLRAGELLAYRNEIRGMRYRDWQHNQAGVLRRDGGRKAASPSEGSEGLA